MTPTALRRVAATATLVSLMAGLVVVLTASRVGAADPWGTYALTFDGTAVGRGGGIGASGGLITFDGGPGDVIGRLDAGPSSAAQASSVEPGTVYRLVAGQVNDGAGEQVLGEPTTARAEFPGDVTEDDATQAEPAVGPLAVTGARSHAVAAADRAVAEANVGSFAAADGQSIPVVEVLGAFGTGTATVADDGPLAGRVSVGAAEVRVLDVLVLTDVVGTATVGAEGDERTATAEMTVGGISVAGTPVVFGADGLLVADQELLPGSELAAGAGQVNAVLEAVGIHIVAVEARETTDATRSSASTGGIGIDVVTPSSSGVPRNELSLIIGGATATLYAEPPFQPSTPAPTSDPTVEPEPVASPDESEPAGDDPDAGVATPRGGGGELTVPPTVGQRADPPAPSVAPEANPEPSDAGEQRLVVAGQVMTARTVYAGFAAWLLFTSLVPLGAAWWLQSRGSA